MIKGTNQSVHLLRINHLFGTRNSYSYEFTVITSERLKNYQAVLSVNKSESAICHAGSRTLLCGWLCNKFGLYPVPDKIIAEVD